MQYNYKTQELVDKGVDFSTIYPEKQTAVKEMTGFDFNLSNIVSFLKKETDNYQKQLPLALELDKHIYAIYLKSGQKPSATPKATPSENETVIKLKKEISELNDLIEMESDEKKIKVFEKEISELNDLIEMES